MPTENTTQESKQDQLIDQLTNIWHQHKTCMSLENTWDRSLLRIGNKYTEKKRSEY